MPLMPSPYTQPYYSSRQQQPSQQQQIRSGNDAGYSASLGNSGYGTPYNVAGLFNPMFGMGPNYGLGGSPYGSYNSVGPMAGTPGDVRMRENMLRSQMNDANQRLGFLGNNPLYNTQTGGASQAYQQGGLFGRPQPALGAPQAMGQPAPAGGGFQLPPWYNMGGAQSQGAPQMPAPPQQQAGGMSERTSQYKTGRSLLNKETPPHEQQRSREGGPPRLIGPPIQVGPDGRPLTDQPPATTTGTAGTTPAPWTDYVAQALQGIGNTTSVTPQMPAPLGLEGYNGGGQMTPQGQAAQFAGNTLGQNYSAYSPQLQQQALDAARAQIGAGAEGFREQLLQDANKVYGHRGGLGQANAAANLAKIKENALRDIGLQAMNIPLQARQATLAQQQANAPLLANIGQTAQGYGLQNAQFNTGVQQQNQSNQAGLQLGLANLLAQLGLGGQVYGQPVPLGGFQNLLSQFGG